MRKLFPMLMALTLAAVPAAAEQTDTRGCADHPLFTRMATYWIQGCTQKDFDAFEFVVGAKGKKQSVEGALWKANYYPQATAKSTASALQILRNFENAAKSLGGEAVFVDKNQETLRVARDGKEYWVDVRADHTGKYWMVIVAKQAMAQTIEANADVFADNLKTSGHAAVYGILFDTGKADIKPESAQAVGEIAKLLKADGGLKLHVVGHTDAVGGVESNLKLSEARAAAVLQALVKDHGIAAARLRAFGNGPFAPVATNDTEEGRAKNRRVELVKQ